MDRFIVIYKVGSECVPELLKSNMDRFIVNNDEETENYNHFLKSNMDRFIVCFECCI